MFPSRIASVLGGGAGLPNAYSVSFDGSDEYVNIADDSTLDITGDFSLACWFKFEGSDAPGLVGKWTAAQNSGYAFKVTSNKIRFYSNGEYEASDTDINDGLWHHLVGTWDGSNAHIYLDGVLDDNGGTGGFANPVANNDNFFIGRIVSVSDYFQGNIDEVSLWNKALSAGNISALYQARGTANLNDDGNSANLQGWWRMGDGDTYPTITDNSTNSNDGTMTNMAAEDIVKDTP